MRTTVGILIALTAVLLVSCLYLGYQVLDQAVSLDHARSSHRLIEKELEVLRSLTLDMTKGTKRDAIRDLLASKYAKEHLIKEEGEDTIYVDNVGLRFRGNELVGIVFVSDESSRKPLTR